jgi:hypothetical protein
MKLSPNFSTLAAAVLLTGTCALTACSEKQYKDAQSCIEDGNNVEDCVKAFDMAKDSLASCQEDADGHQCVIPRSAIVSRDYDSVYFVPYGMTYSTYHPLVMFNAGSGGGRSFISNRRSSTLPSSSYVPFQPKNSSISGATSVTPRNDTTIREGFGKTGASKVGGIQTSPATVDTTARSTNNWTAPRTTTAPSTARISTPKVSTPAFRSSGSFGS